MGRGGIGVGVGGGGSVGSVGVSGEDSGVGEGVNRLLYDCPSGGVKIASIGKARECGEGGGTTGAEWVDGGGGLLKREFRAVLER